MDAFEAFIEVLDRHENSTHALRKEREAKGEVQANLIVANGQIKAYQDERFLWVRLITACKAACGDDVWEDIKARVRQAETELPPTDIKDDNSIF